MGNLFFEYFIIEEEKWREMSNITLDKFKNLLLGVPYKRYTFTLQEAKMEKIERKEKLHNLIITLNNKISALRISYISLSYYYEMGILDESWFISPGKDGSSIQYFPDFEEKHLYILYFFHFWCENFYIKFFSIVDSIFEFLNYYFGFNFEPEKEKYHFREKVIKELRNKKSDLYGFLFKIKKTEVYQNAEKIRNEIMHGIPLYEIKNTIIKRRTSISIGVGEYKTSRELKENIEGLLKLLGEVMEKIKELMK